MTAKKSFVFYRSFYEALSNISDEKSRLQLYEAICKYSLDLKEPKLIGSNKTIWILIKPLLDSNIKKYIDGCKGGKFGHLGGRPKTPKPDKKNPTKTPSKPHKNPKRTPNADADVDVDANGGGVSAKSKASSFKITIPPNLPEKIKTQALDLFLTRLNENKLKGKNITSNQAYFNHILLEEFGYKPDGARVKEGNFEEWLSQQPEEKQWELAEKWGQK